MCQNANLVGTEWDGRCPECEHQEMYFNLDGSYECPLCRMQMLANDDGVRIQETKGVGRFSRSSGLRIPAGDNLAKLPQRQIVEDQRKKAA